MGSTEFYVPGPPGAGLLAFPGGSSASSPLTSGPVGARSSLAQRSGVQPAPCPPRCEPLFYPKEFGPTASRSRN